MTDVAAATATAPPMHPSAWKSPSGFGFRDLIDVINPLQHLPIISSVYRWLTGDRPGEAAQMAGDALYGGPIGVGFSLLGAALEDKQGHDLGEQALIAMFGSRDGSQAVAKASPAATPAPAAAAAAAPSAQAASQSPSQAAATSRAAEGQPLSFAPQRQPIPLFGGIAQPVPSPAGSPGASAAPAPSAAQAFEAHQAMLERSITTGRIGPRPTAPVPLVLPAGTLLNRVQVRSAVVPAAPAAASATTATPATAAAPPNPAQPQDISQKMLDALDKYMQMEREKKDGATPAPAGSSVDLAL